jgi:hypothetical protein
VPHAAGASGDEAAALQKSVRSYEAVEEHDPLEQLRAHARSTKITSLEEEYEQFTKQVDINDFEYKAVPRTEEDDDE